MLGQMRQRPETGVVFEERPDLFFHMPARSAKRLRTGCGEGVAQRGGYDTGTDSGDKLDPSPIFTS